MCILKLQYGFYRVYLLERHDRKITDLSLGVCDKLQYMGQERALVLDSLSLQSQLLHNSIKISGDYLQLSKSI